MNADELAGDILSVLPGFSAGQDNGHIFISPAIGQDGNRHIPGSPLVSAHKGGNGGIQHGGKALQLALGDIIFPGLDLGNGGTGAVAHGIRQLLLGQPQLQSSFFDICPYEHMDHLFLIFVYYKSTKCDFQGKKWGYSTFLLTLW